MRVFCRSAQLWLINSNVRISSVYSAETFHYRGFSADFPCANKAAGPLSYSNVALKSVKTDKRTGKVLVRNSKRVTITLQIKRTGGKILIKKSISSFLIVVLLFVIFPFTTTVSATTLQPEDVLEKINAIETDTYYDGLGQCYGFAKRTFAYLFDLDTADFNWDYTDGTESSDYLYLVKETYSESELLPLLSLAQAGDVLCYGGGGGNPHSMIYIGRDDANEEITVLDANWGSNNIIRNHTISYDQLNAILEIGNGLFLFRYTPAQLTVSESLTLYLGADAEEAAAQLTYAVSPETSPAPAWSSSDDYTVTVSRDGTVTAVNPGTAVVTCQIGDKTAQCVVTVELKKAPAAQVKSNLLTLVNLPAFLPTNSEPPLGQPLLKPIGAGALPEETLKPIS